MSDADTPTNPNTQMPDDRTIAARASEEAAELRQYLAEQGIPAPTPLPEKIGRYRITRWIGAGGMGEVYEAEQVDTGQDVALKIVRGPASAEAQKLFEYERRLHGRLRHPAIGRIFDAGHTEDGQPYFVMELIEGQSITEHCRLADLSLRGRLALFGAVCDAVQYLHDRGVIHRDLKPANILVDEDGQPCVLDFGLARYTDPDAEEPQARLKDGDLLGSLHYMSPEQTREDPADLDVRTDVYSLGVVLYEMLTGSYPYALADSTDEMLHTIREVPPNRPSSIERSLDDDLDTIVLKALEKNRDCRYESARGLGHDIGLYLKGGAIGPKRSNRLYVFRKWVSRNGRWLAPSVAGVVLLMALLGLLVHERRELAQEVNRTKRYYIGRAQNLMAPPPRIPLDDPDDPTVPKPFPEKLDEELPAHESDFEDAVDLLSEALDRYPKFFEALVLRSSCYYHLGLLHEARIDAEAARALSPRDANIWHRLGRVWIALKQTEDAIVALERSIDLKDDFAEAWYDLGRALVLHGEPDRALEAYARATELDPGHTLAWDGIGRVYYNKKGRDPEDISEAAAAFQHAADSDPAYWRAFNYLALCHQILVMKGDYLREGDALHAYGRLLELQPNHVDALNNAAWIQLTSQSEKLRDYDVALARASEADRIKPGHPDFLETLALAELRTGDPEAAREHALRAWNLGNESAWVLLILASAEAGLRNFDAAGETLARIQNQKRPTYSGGEFDALLADLKDVLSGDPAGTEQSEED